MHWCERPGLSSGLVPELGSGLSSVAAAESSGGLLPSVLGEAGEARALRRAFLAQPRVAVAIDEERGAREGEAGGSRVTWS